MVAVAAADSLLDQKEADEANEHCEAAEAVLVAMAMRLLVRVPVRVNVLVAMRMPVLVASMCVAAAAKRVGKYVQKDVAKHAATCEAE